MKVLLVEDSRVLGAVLSARLSSYGHDVCIAENGRVALEKFSQERPDLILMDLEMPEMNGIEATTRIRAQEAAEEWAWTPIVFLTGSDTPENLVTAIEAGADDFMAKTLPESVIQAKMKAMARIAEMRKRLAYANRKLAEQAGRDCLTALPNRRAMDQWLDIAWSRAEQAGAPFGLFMVDVDNFKKYNDFYGHQAGDECLRQVAIALEQVAETVNRAPQPSPAFAARYGGEEFAILLPQADEATYVKTAAHLVQTVRNLDIPHAGNADHGRVTVSLGGAYLKKTAGMIGPLFRLADSRLYQAKHAGRNRAELN